MFQLDDKFLADVGLQNMPENEKEPFLQHIYEQLEQRVGVKLSEGLTDAQLEEFERITDRDQKTVDGWLAMFVPDYMNDDMYKRMQEATKMNADDLNLKAEFAATKWLEVNRPDYRQVVAEVLTELKKEISSNADKILNSQSQ